MQARSHAKFLRLVRNFAEVRVWSRTPAHAQQFAEDIGAKYVPVAEDAVRGADVVVTATSATEPIVFGDWLKPGIHVNAIGWCGTNSRELDDKAMHNVLFVESRDAVLKESGDVILSKARVYAELGEVLASKKPLHAEKTTYLNLWGWL